MESDNEIMKISFSVGSTYYCIHNAFIDRKYKHVLPYLVKAGLPCYTNDWMVKQVNHVRLGVKLVDHVLPHLSISSTIEPLLEAASQPQSLQLVESLTFHVSTFIMLGSGMHGHVFLLSIT